MLAHSSQLRAEPSPLFLGLGKGWNSAQIDLDLGKRKTRKKFWGRENLPHTSHFLFLFLGLLFFHFFHITQLLLLFAIAKTLKRSYTLTTKSYLFLFSQIRCNTIVLKMIMPQRNNLKQVEPTKWLCRMHLAHECLGLLTAKQYQSLLSSPRCACVAKQAEPSQTYASLAHQSHFSASNYQEFRSHVGRLRKYKKTGF